MYTATAMVLPLAIHLWNLRKGRTLKIGSLSLISETVQQNAKQLRITEWLLLLLRCLLLLLLALLLSKPVWKQPMTSAGNKGWILVPKESMHTLYPVFKKEIDSLVSAGFEWHYFNFPFDPATSIAAADSNYTDHSTYWQRIAQLNSRLPEGFPVKIFSEASMYHFAGNKPPSALSIQWKLATPAAPALQLVKAIALGNDSLALKFMSGAGDKNYFVQQHTGINSADIHIQQSGNGASVQWKDGVPVKIDTGALRITVYQKGYSSDAVYVSAALEALQPLLDRPLKLSQTTDPSSIPVGQAWVFWLSDENPPVTTGHTIYLSYATGNIRNTESHITSAEANSASLAGIPLYKRISYTDSGHAASPVWKDGFGQALLAQNADSKQLRLYTHFDPSWNGMVWNAAFPELLFGLLDEKTTAFQDLRQIDSRQLVFLPTAAAKQENISKWTDLSIACCWLLLLCLAAERWLSLRTKKTGRAA